MKLIKRKAKNKRAVSVPRIFGVGLFALDLVFQREGAGQFFAGGTCGNVLLALAYMGWQSCPISRLADDQPGRWIRTEFETWGGDTAFLTLDPPAPTPVIVERLSQDASGFPYHSFSFSCPSCGGRLPMFRPITLNAANQVIPSMVEAEVLFIDRISPSSIALAKAAREQGAIVYFEPSSIRDSRQFRKLLSLCHVVKYSQDRIDDIGDTRLYSDLLLEIQTLGRGGIRFRTKLDGQRDVWHTQPAVHVDKPVDTTGAGDWFSAGFIHTSCRLGLTSFRNTSLADLSRSLTVAQGLAAWTCGYVGARGGMYQTERSSFLQLLRKLQTDTIKHSRLETNSSQPLLIGDGSICLKCEPDEKFPSGARSRAMVSSRFM